MASYDDILNDDPINFGMMQAAQALLTPRARGGGLGAAFGSFGATVSRERQNQIENQLKKDLIESRRRDRNDPLRKTEGLPSDVRSAIAYMQGSPEYKAAYDLVTKQAKIFDVAGIKYTRDANGNVTQLTPTQEAALNAEILARAKAFAAADEKARFNINPVTGPDGRLTYGTDERILSGQGVMPMAPRFPNAVTQPPVNPGFPQKLIPELPPGTTPQQSINGMSVPELTAYIRSQSPPIDPQGNLVAQRMLTDGLPGPLRPAAVAQKDLDVQKAAAIDANKSAQGVADERAERERGFAELEKIFDQAETLLPFATGSDIGSIRDRALRAVGISTDASKAAASLEAIQAQAMRYVPRFKGQDSDRDVATYRQAIAVLGDRSQTVEDRQKAIKELRKLMAKAKSQGAEVGTEVPVAKPDNDPLGLRR